ncbi:hypothetical protein RJ55_10051 [Drechmeria coniospora]|nr:hypothetical protein RJ55_10051 [Drechmeria coniospora]
MSAVALQFDPTFSMGPRSAFSWSLHLDSSSTTSSVLGTDINSIMSGSEPSMTPPSETKSLSSSPSRATLTPELQEMKWHSDRARRDSKLSARYHHASSGSYTTSPPMAMGEVTNGLGLGVYTTGPASMPSLVTTDLHAQSYLPSYSPTLHSQSQGSQMFASPYQQPMPHSYGVSMDYSPTFAGSHGDYSTRPHSLPISPDTGMMYQLPTVAPPTNPAAHERSHVRVVHTRPKPRCWEHGCNGRQFSTFSNLLRHQREKSGQATKASCPNCGAEFTRTTARNGHLLHDKCKQRKKT